MDEIRELIAKEGQWLTQAVLADENERIYAKRLLTPNVDLWRDATQEEKDKWDEEHPQPEEPIE